MAKRYSGNLQISVVYDDKNHYRTAVSSGGKLLWRGIVNPAPAGFGPGVAYDSPKAYDEIASSALAFAEDEKGGIADEADFDEDLTGYLIRRTPRGRKSSSSSSAHTTKKITSRHHETKKKSRAQLDREIAEALTNGGAKRHGAVAHSTVATRDYEYVVYPEATHRHAERAVKIPRRRGKGPYDLTDAKQAAKQMGSPAAIYSVSQGRFVGYVHPNGRYQTFR